MLLKCVLDLTVILHLFPALVESQRDAKHVSQSKPSQNIHEEKDPTQPTTTTQKQQPRDLPLPITTTNAGQLDTTEPSSVQEPSDRKARLMLEAPVVRYDVDIQYNWNESQLDIPELHRSVDFGGFYCMVGMVTCLLCSRNTTGLGRAFTSPESEGKVVSEVSG